ncbi:MAG: carboxypeptidase regulatory-like domain-containing protein, partial [Gemmatimonadetes bacterium]|nr:carboxypeptidase regulatory-like domain-containing protein [Gemmatimonadota bacterium]
MLACVAVPPRVLAQSVRGTIVDEAGSPIVGALVTLESTSGVRVAATVSSSAGTYLISVPDPGSYRLRIERIGFADSLIESFDVEAERTVVRRLRLATVPVPLRALMVTGERECDVRPAEGAAAWVLWHEARKALAITAWTEERTDVRYHGYIYVAVVDTWGQPQGPREEIPVVLYGEHPFRAASVEDLAERGYLWEGDDGGLYGPDAQVLLSDSFLDTHCFRARPGKDDTEGLVGLAFEPVRTRDVVEVKGVLWLDEATAELRHIEFTYTNLPRVLSNLGLSGRLVFERLETGHWVVGHWWIRAPAYEDRFPLVQQLLHLTLRESGGVITSVEFLPAVPEAPVERVQPAPELLAGVGAVPPPGPPIPDEVLAALSQFGDSPDSVHVAELLHDHYGFATDPDAEGRLAIASLWNRAGEPELALETMAALPDTGVHSGLLSLQRARSLFALGLAEEGASEFWAACDRLNEEVRDEFWRDLRALATPGEIQEWKTLPPVPSSCSWIRRFVAERARLRAVTETERLTEHYVRLEHARYHYWLRGPRLTPAISDREGRDPGLEFDDRGLVYVRLGEPDAWAFWTPNAPCMPSTETWRYYLPEGPRFYHFSPANPAFDPGSSFAGDACAPPPVADYRLHGSLAATLGIRQATVLRQAGRMIFGGPRIEPGLLTELYLTRAGLDPSFAVRAYRFRTHSVNRVITELERERVAGLEDVRELLQSIPDVPSVRPRLRMLSEVLRFRGQEADEWRVWILASVRAGDLK